MDILIDSAEITKEFQKIAHLIEVLMNLAIVLSYTIMFNGDLIKPDEE